MSLKSTHFQRSFYHTSTLCDEMFDASDRYRLFREKILPRLFALRGKLASLYCDNNGRPAVDPVVLAGVTLLQFMEKASDRMAAEQVVYHLGWKYALDLELSDGGFHPTVLVYFRDRLEENKIERLLFDEILELLVEAGLVKRTGKQRLDSTHVLGYVKQMSRLECAVETLRLTLEALAKVVADTERPQFWERLWTLYVQSQVDWRLSKAEREDRYRRCGQDMAELLGWVETNRSALGEVTEVKLLQRVFQEQFELVEEKLQPQKNRAASGVQNPHDPQAHFADKRKTQWVGYKVHVVETVEPERTVKVKGEPGGHFITEMITTAAAQDEMAGLTEALHRQAQHEFKPEVIYADAGYITENTLTQAEQNRFELLGPTRPDPHHGPYNSDAFSVDVDKREAICPQGNKNYQWSRIRDRYMGTEYYRIEWGSQCDCCSIKSQCTRSKNGRRILVVGLRHDLVQKRRKEMKEAWFSKSMHPRNGIEGTHSELVRGHGMRRTKYRGLSRVSLSHYFMGAACNVKRYLNVLAFQMRQTALSPALG